MSCVRSNPLPQTAREEKYLGFHAPTKLGVFPRVRIQGSTFRRLCVRQRELSRDAGFLDDGRERAFLTAFKPYGSPTDPSGPDGLVGGRVISQC